MKEDHSIIDPKSDLHIRLKLDGIFLMFETRSPMNSDLFDDKDATVVNITPQGSMWDSNSRIYSENESSMIDLEGDLINRTPDTRIIIDEDDEML